MTTDEVKWAVLGASVTGASHVRQSKPNQDAIGWWPGKAPAASSALLALADGHGGERYVRSGDGAQMAVASLLDEFDELLRVIPHDHDVVLSSVNRYVREELPKRLCKSWERRVEQNLSRRPLTELELEVVSKNRKLTPSELGKVAHGCTLLGVMVTPVCVVYLQLGDGDVLIVNAAGEVERPFPKDARLIANETTSLSMQDAWKDVNVAFMPLIDPPPPLIMLSTDGYANSFLDEAAFIRVASDMLEMVVSEGLQSVSQSLPAWLDDASTHGSGDDVTLGMLVRLDSNRSLGKAHSQWEESIPNSEDSVTGDRK